MKVTRFPAQAPRRHKTMSGIDRPRIEAAVLEILAAIGEDPSRDGLLETPRRVADAYAEFYSGLGTDPTASLADSVDVDGKTGEVVLLRNLEFRSVCEHHLLPFTGIAHVAYVPRNRVVGLGRLPAVLASVANRPQLQERLGEEVADAIWTGLEPRGVLVVIDAVHGCVTTRGPRQLASSTVTVASRGTLAEPLNRAELMALIGSGA